VVHGAAADRKPGGGAGQPLTESPVVVRGSRRQ